VCGIRFTKDSLLNKKGVWWKYETAGIGFGGE
jgi:hypothetical protein